MGAIQVVGKARTVASIQRASGGSLSGIYICIYAYIYLIKSLRQISLLTVHSTKTILAVKITERQGAHIIVRVCTASGPDSTVIY